MTDERLAEIEANAAREPGMRSGCSDYACYCHFAVPELVAEVRRLRAVVADLREAYERLAEGGPDPRPPLDINCPVDVRNHPEWAAAVRELPAKGEVTCGG